MKSSNYAITLLDVLDFGADFVHDTHPLMAENITTFQLHHLFMIEMQIRTTNRRSGYFANNVLGICDGWDRRLDNTDI